MFGINSLVIVYTSMLLLFSALPIFTEGVDFSILFLSSRPINADVLLDGVPLEQQTPLLLRDVEAGKHGVEVRKEGYAPERLEVELSPGQIESLVVDLAGQYFSPAFPEEERVKIGETEEEAEEDLIELPQGIYSFHRQNEMLNIDPVFPQDGWIKGLNLAAPLSIAFSTVLTLHDIFYPKRAAVRIGSDFSLSPATLTAYGVSLTLVGFDIALHIRRQKARKAFAYRTVTSQQALHSAKDYYERAENLLTLGQLEEALRLYTRVLEGYRDSTLYPYALFKTARIHFLMGEDSLAALEFNLITERYPLPDLYDKAQRSLADILVRQKNYQESIAHLRAMVFADPLYGREEIDLLQAEILESWYSEDPAVLDRVIQAYEALVSTYPASDSLDLYRYRTAFYLHRAQRDAEAEQLLEQIDLNAVGEELAVEVRDLLGSIREGE